MTFGNPQAFWLMLLLPVLALFFVAGFKAKRAALARFGNPDLMARLAASRSVTRQYVKMFLFLGGLFWLVFALGRPQFGMVVETVRRQGYDLVIALDVSSSMLAQDLKPNRLVRAKGEIQSLLERLKGHRVGLVVFAGSAFLQCPLTTDYRAISLFLDGIDTNTIPLQGSDLADAIRSSVQAFEEKSGAFRAVLLITDGEDTEGKALEAAKEAASAGVRIFAIGIGSLQGEPIPVDKKGGEGGYKKSKTGEIVLTRLDAATLGAIAQTTRGSFHQASRDELELASVMRQLENLERHELHSKEMARYRDQFQIFLALALLLLAAEWFFSDRKPESEEWHGRFA